MLDLIQRLILILIIIIISAELFNLYDWKFWVISIGIGFVCYPKANPFNKIKKRLGEQERIAA